MAIGAPDQIKGAQGNFVGLLAVSFDSTPDVGDLVIAACTSWRSGGATISSFYDNQSNSYTQDQTQAEGSEQDIYFYSAPISTASGTFTVTVDWDYSCWCNLIISEYSGVDDSSGRKDTGGGTNGSANTNVDGPTLNPTASNCLYVGCMSHEDSQTSLTIDGGDWTQRSEQEAAAAGQPWNFQTAEGSGSKMPGWTMGSSSGGWLTVGVCYKPAETIVECDATIASVTATALGATAVGDGTATATAGIAGVTTTSLSPSASGSGSAAVSAGLATATATALGAAVAATGSAPVTASIAAVTTTALDAAALGSGAAPASAAIATITSAALDAAAIGIGTAALSAGIATLTSTALDPAAIGSGSASVTAGIATLTSAALDAAVVATGAASVTATLAGVTAGALDAAAVGSGAAAAAATLAGVTAAALDASAQVGVAAGQPTWKRGMNVPGMGIVRPGIAHNVG